MSQERRHRFRIGFYSVFCLSGTFLQIAFWMRFRSQKPTKKPKDVCDKLDEFNIDVDRCFTEKDLLLKWVEIMQEENPDYITGYNIFGFDFNFIIERVKILFPGEEDKFYQ